MPDIAFSKNWQHLYFVNVTPGAKVPTWARLAAGISSPDSEGNEEVDQTAYLDGEGGSSSEITGGQLVLTFEGNRLVGDPAQDYIASLLLVYGDARKTDFRWVAPNGDVIEGNVTLANIKVGGGDANSKDDFSVEVQFNGTPKYTPGDARKFPTAIKADDVSVTVGTTASAGASVEGDDAAPGLVYGIEDTDIAMVDPLGTVTGVKEGETKLSIKSAVLPSVLAEVTVTVGAAASQSRSASKATTAAQA